MAAPDSTVSRLGQVNTTGDAQAIFLKLFSGEVLTQFDKTTTFIDKHQVRNIASGKSAQFPVIGRKSGASYHTPGTWIDGDQIKHAELTITIDDLLVSPMFIANIDEAMNHYEVRAEYSNKMGEELAQAFDANVGRMGILAARASHPISGETGGSEITNASMKVDSTVLKDAMFAAAQAFDEKWVPEGDRYAFFKPAQFYLMAKNTDLINKDWAGAGSLASGMIETLAGFPIVKTNNLPVANDSANTAIPSKYRGNFSTTAGLIWHRSAVGTVKLLDLAIDTEYEPRNQGTFMVGKYAVGHGYLRPECAIELKTA